MTTATPSITIPHLGTFPLSMLEDFAGLVPIITKGIGAGKSAQEIKTELETAAVPAVLQFAETALNIVFPGSGTLLEAVAWLVDNSKGAGAVKTIPGYGPDGREIPILNPDYKET
jgi:hypothetical protein